MKKSRMILQMAIGILVVALLTANLVMSMRKETPNIKPLDSFLMPTKDDWKVTYGDTLETQIVYNLAVMRFDQKAIFALVESYHPRDPNEVKAK
ncbi:hypothetical protein LCGC14_1918320 [marine sediment metagenome]|uniref:Uncharacterized protein n=1 Tax=marine sediment metagenome TaxID=412755 RepID=A0A0F9FSB2_9ZZZZ